MKKFTMFVSRELQENLLASKDWTETYRVAVEFFCQLVAYGNNTHDQGLELPRHGGDGGGFAKSYCGCHTESQTMKGIFLEAKRVEAHFILVHPPRLGPSEPIALEVRFRAYRRREKEYFQMKVWQFNKENARHQVVNPNAR